MNRLAVRTAAAFVATAALLGVLGGSAGAAPRLPDPDTEFVAAVYHVVLGPSRGLDESGRAYWTGKLTAGQTRASVADQIARSREANKAYVTEAFERYLGRPVDPTGLATYTGYLNSGNPASYVVNRLNSAPETYDTAGGTAGGYVSYLYDVFFDRSASTADKAFWSARMPDPTSSLQRKGVAYSIARSGEATRAAIAEAADRACGSPNVSPSVASTLRADWTADGHNILRLAAAVVAIGCTAPV